MRERQIQMSFRVFPTEKKTIIAKAKQYGMNTSEYLRTCALDKEIKIPPSPDFKKLYQIIQRLRNRFRYENGFTKTNADLTEAEDLLLELYHKGG